MDSGWVVEWEYTTPYPEHTGETRQASWWAPTEAVATALAAWFVEVNHGAITSVRQAVFVRSDLIHPDHSARVDWYGPHGDFALLCEAIQYDGLMGREHCGRRVVAAPFCLQWPAVRNALSVAVKMSFNAANDGRPSLFDCFKSVDLDALTGGPNA